MQASLCTQLKAAQAAAPAQAVARRPLAVAAALPDNRQPLRSAGLAVAGCLLASQLLMAPVSLAGEPGYKGVVPSTEKDQPAPSTAPLSGPSSGTDAKNPFQKRAAKQAAGDLEQADSANAARKGTSNAGNPFSQGSEVPESTRGQLLAEPLNVWQKIGRAFGKQS
ncbi:hypothetical protein CHLNCDRAFT_137418 [Chlorella variabilis]|uniref:Uncharacterized protein n=1 Tax=Chlorella variabilis TaxID=554065 RepID=E1ZME2_CHLVA|nr:hypothetical protein CHLNCDRAFT_137418 [Chlorella variabilis]EFN52989.1 hypothetical protein CHLNCDRAFT_137418 [Chlorella variabilis]|eukprot:XP_005845091.1 hypothetical protein CHLNCDRAFT_137418 [Chlorella variabilis]